MKTSNNNGDNIENENNEKLNISMKIMKMKES